MPVSAPPNLLPRTAANRRELPRIFGLPDALKRKLWRQRYDRAQPNIYRGYSPLLPGPAQNAEGFDMGPDLAHRRGADADDDPLLEATPLPGEIELPGWRAAASAYYRAKERTARLLMAAIARGMRLDKGFFDAAFDSGNSTLRILRYPNRAGPGAAEHSSAIRTRRPAQKLRHFRFERIEVR
jgi:isopenicillin N synthase-like dioxygenase